MMLLDGIHPVRDEDRERVAEVWEASVRATHTFLSGADIDMLKPLAREALLEADGLECVRGDDGQVAGFLGVDGWSIEMLFIHPSWRGMGAGRRLVEHAVNAHGARRVDVNEQNEQAVGFYLRMGFEVDGRSDVDGMGLPFPLLHMRLPGRA
jgi:putative acetyltransferase